MPKLSALAALLLAVSGVSQAATQTVDCGRLLDVKPANAGVGGRSMLPAPWSSGRPIDGAVSTPRSALKPFAGLDVQQPAAIDSLGGGLAYAADRKEEGC
ncbi:hypothetical protein D3872_05025 [Massilia cavernae]|uniref:Uncharacterized protein n=1 Tax=Massilia cavernae TaxID=2320864 RepID=A0A418Y644_9BURK|nr:hypothetical protein D3872_05025 [Massilia cavernae]